MKYFLCLVIGGAIGYFLSGSWPLQYMVKDVQLTSPPIDTELNKLDTSPEIDESSLVENIVRPSEIQKIRITENINICLDSVNPDPENMTSVSDQAYGLKGLEAQLNKLKVELFSYSSLLDKLEQPIRKKWSVIKDTNSNNELINLSFNLDDTDFVCQYDNNPKSPELTRVSRNGQVVFDIDKIARIKEIDAANREKAKKERKEKLELQRRLDDELKTYRKQKWKVESYSNVEYKSYLKHHEDSQFKSQSPYLKITCLPQSTSVSFENSGVDMRENYPVDFKIDGVLSTHFFEFYGMGDVKDNDKIISLLKISEEVSTNDFTFKIENLDQVPCL
jgi:hypothetical protein